MGPGILPETTVHKHNTLYHLQMPATDLSCKKEVICEHGPEALSCPVGQGSFKVENCSMVRRMSELDILVGNHGHRVLWAKEEGGLPACYLCSVQKPAYLMVWEWGVQRQVCLAYSQAWWWECHGLGLHECCRHWGATVHRENHECQHVLWHTEAEHDPLPSEIGPQGSVPTW